MTLGDVVEVCSASCVCVIVLFVPYASSHRLHRKTQVTVIDGQDRSEHHIGADEPILQLKLRMFEASLQGAFGMEAPPPSAFQLTINGVPLSQDETP